MFKDLVKKTRSIRRFKQDRGVPMDTLKQLVDVARLSASGANRQPLKYTLCNDPAVNAEVFDTLAWAGYLKDWEGPREGERPAAYAVVLADREISKGPGCDHGIAAQALVLAAAEQGIGACMIGSVQHRRLRAVLEIDERYGILLVIALGEPAETVVLEAAQPGGSIEYWRDDQGVHHVPKRPLDEVIVSARGA